MPSCSAKMNGGKRRGKTHKRHGKKHGKTQKKGPSEWNKKVMEIYRRMKKSNPAMKEASRLKKKGQL